MSLVITEEALEEATTLLPDKSIEDIRDMVRRAARVTHPWGNRRFEDIVFDVSGDYLMGIVHIDSDTGEPTDAEIQANYRSAN